MRSERPISDVRMPRVERVFCGRRRRGGSFLMWDNKPTDSLHTFPNSHLEHFKRYIRGSIEKRVTRFVIIVPDVDDVAEENCLRLKFESQQDADVCSVTAEDLKWLAEILARAFEEGDVQLGGV